MSLWGDHDELYGHFRRYRRGELRDKLQAAGFELVKLSYFEPLFLAPLWLYRKWKRLRPKRGGLAQQDDFVATPGPLTRCSPRRSRSNASRSGTSTSRSA
jgi:hypothetical protein